MIFDYRIVFQAYVFWHVFDILFLVGFLSSLPVIVRIRLFLRFLHCLVTSGYFIEVLERHGLPGGFWAFIATNFRNHNSDRRRQGRGGVFLHQLRQLYKGGPGSTDGRTYCTLLSYCLVGAFAFTMVLRSIARAVQMGCAGLDTSWMTAWTWYMIHDQGTTFTFPFLRDLDPRHTQLWPTRSRCWQPMARG